MTHSLILDTCTERGVVGIFHQENLLYSQELPFGYQSSKYLLPTIEEGFGKAGIKPGDLTYIGVGIGPGSYTGIRLGAMVAKSFAFVCEIPLIGICTLEAFYPSEDGPFAAIIDAKISGACLLIGKQKDNGIIYETEPEVVPLASLPKKLRHVGTLLTPNSQVLCQKIPQGEWNWQETAPNIERMAALVYQKYQNKEYNEGTGLDLLYMRDWGKYSQTT